MSASGLRVRGGAWAGVWDADAERVTAGNRVAGHAAEEDEGPRGGRDGVPGEPDGSCGQQSDDVYEWRGGGGEQEGGGGEEGEEGGDSAYGAS